MKMFLPALALLLACACTVARGGPTEFRIAGSGAHAVSEASAAASYVAHDEDAFRSLWAAHVGQHQMPDVDFSSASAVLLMAGQRPTGGWEIVPRAVRIEGEVLVVEAVVGGPPPGSFATQVLTHPWVVLEVTPKTFQSARWER